MDIAKKQNEDSSFEGQLQAIHGEWIQEVARVKNMTVAKYDKTIKENKVNTGCIQMVDETKIMIYGNAFEALSNPRLQATVENITFFYQHYLILTGFSVCDKLKKFQNLKHLTFRYNDISATSQLSEIEKLYKSIVIKDRLQKYPEVTFDNASSILSRPHGSISIINNSACDDSEFRPWMAYRFYKNHNVHILNGEVMTEDAFRDLMNNWNKKKLFHNYVVRRETEVKESESSEGEKEVKFEASVEEVEESESSEEDRNRRGDPNNQYWIQKMERKMRDKFVCNDGYNAHK